MRRPQTTSAQNERRVFLVRRGIDDIDDKSSEMSTVVVLSSGSLGGGSQRTRSAA